MPLGKTNGEHDQPRNTTYANGKPHKAPYVNGGKQHSCLTKYNVMFVDNILLLDIFNNGTYIKQTLSI